MIDKALEKFNLYSGLLVVSAIFVTAYFVAHLEIKDLDLWLHLASGKFIMEHRFVPLTDIFSNVAYGQYWNNHEWLFQTFIYQIYNFWGMQGLSYMQVGIVLLTLSVLFFIGYSRQRQLLTCGLLLLVYLVFQQRFTIRPDLFSLFFFSLYIYFLAFHLNKRWVFYVFVVLQILWTNIHGFFIFGPLLVFLSLTSEWMKRKVRLPYEWNDVSRLQDDEYKNLFYIFILVSVACVINPHFIEGAIYPLRILFSLSGEQSIFFSYIEELQRPITSGNIFDSNTFVYYKLLIMITVVSFILNRRNIDLSALFIWLIFLVFSLKASRNTVYFAFASYFVVLSNFLYFSFEDVVPLRFTEKKFKYITEAFIKFLLLVWIVNFNGHMSARSYYDFDKYEYKSEFTGVSLRSFPNHAVDFLIDQNITGNFFNDFNSGSYLIGRAYPNIRVFIDGRTELYGSDFFADVYFKMWAQGDKKALDENIEKYHLTGALLNSNRQLIPEEVLQYFYNHPDWILVYFDFDAVIFLKNIPKNQKWIENSAIDLKKWESPLFNIYRMRAHRAIPTEHINRAYTLESMHEFDLARQEAEMAKLIDPAHPDAYKILGKIAAKEKNHKAAFENFRQAAVLHPQDRELKYNVALTLLDLKEYEQAIYMYENIHNKWPKDSKAVFFLAKAHAHNHEFELSMKFLKEALILDPKSAEDVIKIAHVYFEADQYTLAIEGYHIALPISEKNGDLYDRLARSYHELGQEDKAEEYNLKALELDPENKDYKKLRKSFE